MSKLKKLKLKVKIFWMLKIQNMIGSIVSWHITNPQDDLLLQDRHSQWSGMPISIHRLLCISIVVPSCFPCRLDLSKAYWIYMWHHPLRIFVFHTSWLVFQILFLCLEDIKQLLHCKAALNWEFDHRNEGNRPLEFQN